jgi:hypothetical protein
LAVWLSGVVYCLLGLRMFTNEATLDASRRSARMYAWAHRLVGVFGTAACLAALAWAHLGRGLGTSQSLPGLIVASLLPLVIGQETLLVNRLLRAAELEHAERLATAQQQLANLAAETSGRLGGLALGELIHLAHDADARAVRSTPAPGDNLERSQSSTFEFGDAVAALRDAPDLIAALPRLTPAGEVPPETLDGLLNSALAGWPGTHSVRVSGRDFGLSEAEWCMRLTRQLVTWLAEGHAPGLGALVVDLEGQADAARLEFQLDLPISERQARALADRLGTAARPAGQLELISGKPTTLTVTWGSPDGALANSNETGADAEGEWAPKGGDAASDAGLVAEEAGQPGSDESTDEAGGQRG